MSIALYHSFLECTQYRFIRNGYKKHYKYNFYIVFFGTIRNKFLNLQGNKNRLFNLTKGFPFYGVMMTYADSRKRTLSSK